MIELNFSTDKIFTPATMVAMDPLISSLVRKQQHKLLAAAFFSSICRLQY